MNNILLDDLKDILKDIPLVKMIPDQNDPIDTDEAVVMPDGSIYVSTIHRESK